MRPRPKKKPERLPIYERLMMRMPSKADPKGMTSYYLHDVPNPLWGRVKIRAKRSGVSIRTWLLWLIRKELDTTKGKNIVNEVIETEVASEEDKHETVTD